jgi:hypothetical protein
MSEEVWVSGDDVLVMESLIRDVNRINTEAKFTVNINSTAVTNWVRHPAKSRSRDLPRDLSRDFMTPYAIT